MGLQQYLRGIDRRTRRRVYLLLSVICYLVGCACWYFLWYKNGEVLHVLIIFLSIGSLCGIIVWIRCYYPIKRNTSHQNVLVITLIFLLNCFIFMVSSAEKNRVESILDNEPTKQTIATVVAVDFKSTRSGKQPWSVINYKADKKIIEQSFVETGTDLAIGRKYLLQYSLEYPDMFRLVKKVN